MDFIVVVIVDLIALGDGINFISILQQDKVHSAEWGFDGDEVAVGAEGVVLEGDFFLESEEVMDVHMEGELLEDEKTLFKEIALDFRNPIIQKQNGIG